MTTAVLNHTATLLNNGQVLVAGGLMNGGITPTSELYNPSTGTWSNTGSLTTPVQFQTATLLSTGPDMGDVLVAGGQTGNFSSSAAAQIYDPTTGMWSAAASLPVAISSQTATLLSDGAVLVAGGNTGQNVPTASAELFGVPELPPPLANTYYAVGADAGAAPQVKVYNAATNTQVASFYAFAPSFTGGVRVAVADVNGDGTSDIICAAGPGGGPQVEVIDGTKLSQLQSNGQIANAALLASFFAFGVPSFSGGVSLAAGTSSSGQNWVAVGAGAGAGPQVEVFTASSLLTSATPTSLTSFFAFTPTFTGGVTVALGDVNSDGTLDVIAGAGPGGGPQVVVFNGAQLSQMQSNGTLSASAVLASFFAFAPSFTGGVFISGGTFGSSQFDLVVGAGPGGGPQVVVINGASLGQLQSNGQIAPAALLDSFFALPSGFTGGVRVGYSAAFGTSSGSTTGPAVLTGAGPGAGPEVAIFGGGTFASLSNFFALPPGFAGGLFVAG
jgi:hypothetical protein